MMALGVILLLENVTAYIPNPNTADVSLELLLLGGLVLVSGWAWSRSLAKTGTISILLVTGLVLLSAGLVAALAGFLLAGQTICGCFIRACDCGATYNAISDVALFFAAVGALATASVLTPSLGPGPSEHHGHAR
jgi:hypothetical protein